MTLSALAYVGLLVLMFGVTLQVVTGINARIFVITGLVCCAPLYIFVLFYSLSGA